MQINSFLGMSGMQGMFGKLEADLSCIPTAQGMGAKRKSNVRLNFRWSETWLTGKAPVRLSYLTYLSGRMSSLDKRLCASTTCRGVITFERLLSWRALSLSPEDAARLSQKYALS